MKRTLEEDAKSGGGKILYEDPNPNDPFMTVMLERNGTPVWVGISHQQVSGGGNAYTETVIEERKLHSEATPSQNAIQTALDKEGHIALHVNFDFDKATLRPDAMPIIREIVGVMKNEPQLRLEIDGHTDSIGPDPYNKTLSEARAKTVVAAVEAGGVDAPRLTSAGFGASKPVAENATSQGRAENRRVELVRQ